MMSQRVWISLQQDQSMQCLLSSWLYAATHGMEAVAFAQQTLAGRHRSCVLEIADITKHFDSPVASFYSDHPDNNKDFLMTWKSSACTGLLCSRSCTNTGGMDTHFSVSAQGRTWLSSQ
jgi:hypothetical protein